jgi:hypothetical protein
MKTQQAWQKNLTPEQEERLAAITAHKKKAKPRAGQEANHPKPLPRVNAGIELMKPALDQLVEDYADHQLRLLKEGVVSTDADLQEMNQIQADIDKAADTQKLLAALAISKQGRLLQNRIPGRL